MNGIAISHADQFMATSLVYYPGDDKESIIETIGIIFWNALNIRENNLLNIKGILTDDKKIRRKSREWLVRIRNRKPVEYQGTDDKKIWRKSREWLGMIRKPGEYPENG